MTHRALSAPEEQRAALLRLVADVRDTVTAYAAEAEERATLPEPMVHALEESGLFRLKLPVELGGIEADPVTQLEVIEALSYVYPSAGWVLMTNATAIGQAGAFLPDEGVDVVFAGGRVPLAATVGGVSSTAYPVSGGYCLSGRWPFVSGVPHAAWISMGATIEADGTRPAERRTFVVPAASVKIHDNWQVAGLQGTGSCDVSVEDLFVPEYLSWNAIDRMHGNRRRGGPIYLLGFLGSVSNEHAGFAAGVGRRALDVIRETSQTKRRGRGTAAVTLIDRPVFQRFAGEADLKLRAARHLTIDVHERAWQTVCEGRPPEPWLEAEMRASAALCTDVAVEVATQAFRFGGGAALHLDNPLQLCLRDINAGAQHLAVSDVAYENHGQFTLGISEASALY